jgi:anti-sigma-K factor RskA
MSLTPDCGTDAAAYVLGALDAPELRDFTRHLSDCSICQAEVESFQQLVNVLPESVPQYAAPTALRRKVVADVRRDALAHGQLTQRSNPGRLRARGDWLPEWARTPVPRFHAGLVGSAVAVVLVIAVVLVGVTAGGATSKAGVVYKASVGSGDVVISGGHAQLIVHRLSHLPASKTYEVWLERAGGKPQPTSVLFNPSSTGDDGVRIPDSLSGIAKVLVTQEPAGGTAKPTTRPVFSASV